MEKAQVVTREHFLSLSDFYLTVLWLRYQLTRLQQYITIIYHRRITRTFERLTAFRILIVCGMSLRTFRALWSVSAVFEDFPRETFWAFSHSSLS